MMTFDEAKRVLAANGQEQVLRFWKQLKPSQRKALLSQIESLDFPMLTRMRGLLEPSEAIPQEDPVAPEVVEWTPELYAKALRVGEKELANGRVAVLLVAGGQGSRLGFDGPKGAFPIGPLTDQPLFYFHARKVLALSKRYQARVPFYIMTSDVNHAATVACFQKNRFFGLPPEDVIFFVQGMLPALDQDGKIMLDRPDHIFLSPDGHGGTLTALAKNGCLADMKARGIRSIFYFQVDNPMVEIADPAFIGLHALEKAEISLKLVAKRDPHEGVGMVVKRGPVFSMIEYSELTEEQATRRKSNGDLYFKYGSVAIHVFSRAFLERESKKKLPLHIAHKKVPYVADDGTIVKPGAPNACKFEKFIFDVLPDAKRVLNLAFDRAEEFSPVKNAEGVDSPASCRHDLQAKWRRWAGIPEDSPIPIEIDPAYARTAEELREKGIRL